MELLVVLAIIALLTQLATPAMTQTVERWRTEKAVRDIVHLIQQGKAKGAQTGHALVICGVANSDVQHHCQKDWSEKVVAFYDVDQNGRFSTGDRLFRVLQWSGRNQKQGATGGGVYSNRHRYSIRPNGTLKSTPGSIFLCESRAQNQAIRVVIDRVGRARVTRQDVRGKPLACVS